MTQRTLQAQNNLMQKYDRTTIKDFDPQQFNKLFAGVNRNQSNKKVLPSLQRKVQTHRMSIEIGQDKGLNTERTPDAGIRGSMKLLGTTALVKKAGFPVQPICNDFIDAGTLAKINYHRAAKSSVYSVDNKVGSHNFSTNTRGSVKAAANKLKFVNPEKTRGDHYMQDLQKKNHENEINNMYWEFQNKEIRKYEVQKFNEKMQSK